jgi:hypothetical protein
METTSLENISGNAFIDALDIFSTKVKEVVVVHGQCVPPPESALDEINDALHKLCAAWDLFTSPSDNMVTLECVNDLQRELRKKDCNRDIANSMIDKIKFIYNPVKE